MPEPDFSVNPQLAKIYETNAAESLQRQNTSGQEFDKQVVYIAGGGLALTLTFAKEIAALTGNHFLLLLLLTWLCFALTLLCNLISHRKAAFSYAAIANINSHYLERYTSNKEVDKKIAEKELKLALSSRKWVVALNIGSLYGVGTGMGSFILFIFLNFFTTPETVSKSRPQTIQLSIDADTVIITPKHSPKPDK